MKRNIIIWGTALILVLMAIYVTKYYDKGNNGIGNSPATQSSAAQSNTPQSTSQQSSGSQSSAAQSSVTQGTSTGLAPIQGITLTDPSARTQAPGFTLADLGGGQVSLKDFKGKNVYLNFWATWCPPCRAEMPDIEKVYNRYKDKDFVVLAVDLGEDGNTVTNFIKQNNYSFKVLLDSDRSVAAQYSISAIPTSYFIDKNGNIAAKRVGALTEEEMDSYVKQLVGE